jgi:predicted AAA+ superfamily ATPase
MNAILYDRSLYHKIEKKLFKGKAIVIIGPRQVGKTTLIKKIVVNHDYLYLNGDDPLVRKKLTLPNTEELKSIIGSKKLVFIDEIQRIPNAGITLKIINDDLKKQLIVSGSSAFEIGNELNEPMTGRKWQYEMYPITWGEFEMKEGHLKAEQQLENRLVYGMYPDVLNYQGEEVSILQNLTDSYLYKDIMALGGMRKPEVLEKLLWALASQIGSEVNYNELAKFVNVDKNTISKYIDLLERAYVIFKLPAFSRNIRNEIKTNKKIYFWDNGIRNMILGDFTSFSIRQDKGALWENFLISERKKLNKYNESLSKSYFWRSTQQQEVDYIELTNHKIHAFEFKWANRDKARIPKTFMQNYNAEGYLIDRNNFRQLLMPLS